MPNVCQAERAKKKICTMYIKYKIANAIEKTR